MNCNKNRKNTRSLGFLRKAEKTKERSPDMTGNITFQRHTFEEITRQYKSGSSGEVKCNIAAWINGGENGGKFLSVEISPWFVGKDRGRAKLDAVDAFFDEDDE